MCMLRCVLPACCATNAEQASQPASWDYSICYVSVYLPARARATTKDAAEIPRWLPVDGPCYSSSSSADDEEEEEEADEPTGAFTNASAAVSSTCTSSPSPSAVASGSGGASVRDDSMKLTTLVSKLASTGSWKR